MTNFKSMRTINKLVASLMVAAMFAAAFMMSGPVASAATGTVVLSGGALTLTAPTAFTIAPVTLDPAGGQTTTGVFNAGVADATATNAGWHLLATMTLMTDGAGHTLPAATIEAAGDIAITDNAGSTAATNSTAYAYTFPLATATTFFNAAIGTGQGSHSYNTTLTQSLPQNTFAGTYTATLTVTLAAGPA